MKKIMLFLAMFSVLLFCSKKNPNDYVVKIGMIPGNAQFIGLALSDSGILEKAGIKYKLILFKSSNEIADAILRGDIDLTIGISTAAALNVSIIDPGKFKIYVAGMIHKNMPMDGILVKKGSVVNSLKELEGKKIGVFPGATSKNALKSLFKKNGINFSNVSFIDIPPQNQLQSLMNGSVDAIHSYEPTVTIGILQGNIRLFGSVFAEQLDPSPTGVNIISQQFINDFPVLADNTVKEIYKVLDYVRNNDIELRKNIFSKEMNIPEEVALKMGFEPGIPIDKDNSIDILQKYADILYDLGEINSKVDVKKIVYVQKK